MLGRDDHAGDAGRLAVHIAQGDLRLGIGQQPTGALVAGMAVFRHLAQDVVRIGERRRHQLGRLIRRIAEHDALVAGPLILVAGRIHARRDIGGLRMQVAFEGGVAPGETSLVVADILHRGAHQVFQHGGGDALRPARLAREDDAVGGDQRLAGHPGIRVGGQEGIEHRVGDPVGNLVGMAFGHGFRSKEIFTLVAHGTVRPLVAWGTGKAPARPHRRDGSPKGHPAGARLCRRAWAGGQGR